MNTPVLSYCRQSCRGEWPPMLGGLFQRAEIKETYLALDRLCADDDNCRLYPMPQVREWVRAAISRDPAKIVSAIRADKLEPSTVVWVLITNVLDRELSCGEHHVYRGMLSMSGTPLLPLWDLATRKLTDAGFHTEEEAAKDRAYIREQIKRAG